MQKKILIGLCGDLKSGKDSVYKALCVGGVEAQRLAFADPLKAELAHACGVTVDFINENKDIFRTGLQWWGTEFRRQVCNESYWVDIAQRRLSQLFSPVVVVTDVRFSNEVDFIRENGGVIWKIIRPLGFCAYFGLIGSSFLHISECLRCEPDFEIVNDGTLEDLNWAVMEAYRATEEFIAALPGSCPN